MSNENNISDSEANRQIEEFLNGKTNVTKIVPPKETIITNNVITDNDANVVLDNIEQEKTNLENERLEEQRINIILHQPYNDLLGDLFMNKYSKKGNIENRKILKQFDTKGMDAVEFVMIMSYFVMYKMYDKLATYTKYMSEDTHHSVEDAYSLIKSSYDTITYDNDEHKTLVRRALKF